MIVIWIKKNHCSAAVVKLCPGSDVMLVAPSLLSGFHPVMRGQGSQVLLDSVGQVDRILRYTNTDGALYLYEEGQYYDQC